MLLIDFFYLSFLLLVLLADSAVQLQSKLLHLLLFDVFIYHFPEVCCFMNQLGSVPRLEIVVLACWLFLLVQNLFGCFP